MFTILSDSLFISYRAVYRIVQCKHPYRAGENVILPAENSHLITDVRLADEGKINEDLPFSKDITRSPCFKPFCFNAPCQYVPLLNLRALVFGLTPFGCLCSIALNPTYSIIYYGKIIFDLYLFICTQFFSNTTRA
jgi:hypothetical protein